MAINVKKEIKGFRQKFAETLIEEGQAVFEAMGLKDSNIAKNYDVKVEGKSFAVYIAEYYIYIESGRKKGSRKPPFDPIFDWIKRNNIKFRDKKGRFITFRQTTFIIMNAIAKNGIKPRPFFQEILDNAEDKATEFVNVFILGDLLNRVIIEELRKV